MKGTIGISPIGGEQIIFKDGLILLKEMQLIGRRDEIYIKGELLCKVRGCGDLK